MEARDGQVLNMSGPMFGRTSHFCSALGAPSQPEKVTTVGEPCLKLLSVGSRDKVLRRSTFSLGWSTMGRVAATSVARIYADVNAKLGPSWHEYGEPGTICSV